MAAGERRERQLCDAEMSAGLRWCVPTETWHQQHRDTGTQRTLRGRREQIIVHSRAQRESDGRAGRAERSENNQVKEHNGKHIKVELNGRDRATGEEQQHNLYTKAGERQRAVRATQRPVRDTSNRASLSLVLENLSMCVFSLARVYPTRAGCLPSGRLHSNAYERRRPLQLIRAEVATA
ncbi:unnamed protein product [Pleuronectes platessa]|uniref:Uncharacterized protein n=1 Tax=Pleuronectes platessa TaxID=8262 RepID=A0A9N7YSX5_PLEPL|nr:unnamed protein product [Pleuronectes platessa]